MKKLVKKATIGAALAMALTVVGGSSHAAFADAATSEEVNNFEVSPFGDYNESATFDWMVEHDSPIQLVGVCPPEDLIERDGFSYYRLERSEIFGPYDRIPKMKIPVKGTDIVLDTSVLGNYYVDYLSDTSISRSPFVKDYFTKHLAVCLHCDRYADGEAYVVVSYFRSVSDLGISAKEYVAGETREAIRLRQQALNNCQRYQVFPPKGLVRLPDTLIGAGIVKPADDGLFSYDAPETNFFEEYYKKDRVIYDDSYLQ